MRMWPRPSVVILVMLLGCSVVLAQDRPRDGPGPATPKDLTDAYHRQELARQYQRQGRFEEAERLYKETLAILERAVGPDHLSVGFTLSNLGGLHFDQGRYVEAETVLRRAVAIQEKVLGADNAQVATALNNLASIYRAQGRYADAEPLAKRSGKTR